MTPCFDCVQVCLIDYIIPSLYIYLLTTYKLEILLHSFSIIFILSQNNLETNFKCFVLQLW